MVSTLVGDYCVVAASEYSLDCALLEAIGWVESGWRVDAISESGARGIMQMTGVALADIGFVGDVMDPGENIKAGAAYLARVRDKYLARFSLEGARLTFWMIVAYHWGPGNVVRHLTHDRSALAVPNEVFVYACRVLREYVERY